MAGSPRIDELKKKFDENPGRYFAPLANEYRKAGEIAQAIEICRVYLAEKPGHMSGLIVFGQALFEAKQFEEARTTFEQALALDPENLIALRHLGDIARDVGDPGAARGWYQRVLDADPRNEEIAAALAAVTAEAAAAGPAPAAESGAEGMSGWADINPEQPEAGAAAAANTVIIEPETPQVAPPVAPTPAPPPHGPSLQIPRISLELGSLEVPPPAAAPAPAPAAPAAAAPPEARTLEFVPPAAEPVKRPSMGVSSLGIEQAQEFESSIGAAGGGAPAGGIELDRPFEAPPTVPPESASAMGLEISEFQPPKEKIKSGRDSISGFVVEEPPAWETQAAEAAPPAPAAPAPGFVTETMAELYLKQGYRAEAIAVYRQLVEQNPGDVALRDKLRGLESEGERRPEPQIPAAIPSVFPAPSAPQPTPGRSGGSGRTVRSFFGSLGTRKAPARPSGPTEGGPSEAGVTGPSDWIMEPAPPASPAPTPASSPVAEAPAAFGSSVDAWPEPSGSHTPTPSESGGWGIAPVTPPSSGSRTPSPRFGSPVVAGTSAVATEAPAPAVTEQRRPPESGSPAASGSLDSLFGGAAVQSSDADAAVLLAGAFGPPQTPAATQQQYPGQPARAASNELSLDNVFRDTPRKSGAVRTTGSFSFDQFFSDNAAGREKGDDAADKSPGTQGGARETAGGDEAQFSSWLEGLKKK